MAAFARAMKESSFLELEATVLSIVKKRFGMNMKKKFSQATEKAEDSGDSINIDFIISFLQKWFKSLNRTYGMSTLIDAKPAASASSSSLSSSSSSPSSSSPSPSSSKKSGAPSSKANVAVVDASSGRRPMRMQQQQQQQPLQQQHRSQYQQQSVLNCFYCGESHQIESCSAFIQLSCQERISAMFKQRLCFKCFQSGHRAVQCRQSTALCLI